jgi:hypothetical protein
MHKGTIHPNQPTQIKVYLGSPTKHNTYEAEAVGAILAIWLVSKCIETIRKAVSLYINNQSIITALSNPKAKPGQYLLRHLNLTANVLACNLGIYWISSHSKVKGNEKVDELAKEAAEGRASSRLTLPQILRNPLPDSASALMQKYVRKLKGKWEMEWEDSDRSHRMAQIDDNFPFHNFRKRTYTLNRHQASLMIQLRSGHIPLNRYLFKIGKMETEL